MNKYKKIIKDRGLKITWVAEQMNVDRSQLSQWINNLVPMPTYREDQLKKVLK